MRAVQFLLLLSCLMPCLIAAEESNAIHVIVNSQSDITSLNEKEVISVFLGRKRFKSNGATIKPYDYKAESSVRAEFYEGLTGKSIADIDAYWARLRYSGRSTPPKALSNEGQIIELCSKNLSAISYVKGLSDQELSQKGIAIVYTLEPQ